MTLSARLQVRNVQPPSPLDPFLILCPSSFPLASLQNWLQTIPGSPSRAVKTIAYATPRQSVPRSGPHIAGHVCILLFSGHSFSFPYVSLPFLFPRIPGSPSFLFYFLLSYRTQDNTPELLVAYLYIIPLAWSRPRERERPIRVLSNPSNIRPFLPLLARVPSPQDSRYACYDSPRAFSAAQERGVSFPPLRLCSPFDREPTLDLGSTLRTHQRGLTTRAALETPSTPYFSLLTVCLWSLDGTKSSSWCSHA